MVSCWPQVAKMVWCVCGACGSTRSECGEGGSLFIGKSTEVVMSVILRYYKQQNRPSLLIGQAYYKQHD